MSNTYKGFGDRRKATGIKFDGGKPRISLISRTFIWGVSLVLLYGERKYAADNWRGGMKLTKLYDGLQRHLTAWLDGEEVDAESGLPHLWHAGCGIMMLSELSATRPDMDDRYKRSPEEQVRIQELLEKFLPPPGQKVQQKI